jgi:hypothetical protein
MARITRRRVLKLSGAGVVAAQTGGLAAILATGRAPAYAQGTNVHWLRWADFVPASDVLLKGQITQECQKATGITLKLETINANDLQSRITSAIQSGTGADITMALGIWPQLYAESLADAGDVTELIGKTQGGYYDVAKLVATVDNKWIGVPWAIGAGWSPIAGRGSKRSGTIPSLRPGTRCSTPVGNSRPRAAPSAKPRDTPSVMRQTGGTLICGPGAARRSRPTARRWS